jgi:hypothetical protein
VAIFFSCSCGQSLRADEDRAGGVTDCPACCRSVRVPSLHWANQLVGDEAPAQLVAPLPREISVPAVPVPRLLLIDETEPTRAPPKPNTPSAKTPFGWVDDVGDESHRRLERARSMQILAQVNKELKEQVKRHKTWRVEANFFECMLYPLRAVILVAGLAFVWAIAIILWSHIWPEHVDLDETMPRLPLLFTILFPIFCYTVRSFQVTYLAAMAGQAGYVVPPDGLSQALLSGMQAIWCFLIGPIVPIGVAIWFWLESGELLAVDAAILWELNIAGVMCWLLLFLAMQGTDRGITYANPLAVAALIRRRGWRLPVGALAMALIIVVTCRMVIGLLADGPVNTASSAINMALCWAFLASGLFFLLRWLGVSSNRRWRERAAKA